MKVIEIKRSLSLLSGLILAATTWVVSLELISDRPVPNAIFAQSIIERKMEAAEKPGKVLKTLVVGGSNVAFGIDTVRMSRTIGEEFVNFGCIAGIGPEIILSALRPSLSEGDRILFCWEYGLYSFKRRDQNITYLNLLFGPQREIYENYPFLDQVVLSLRLPFSHLRDSLMTHLNPYADPMIYKCSWDFDAGGNVRSNAGVVTSEEELLKKSLDALCTELIVSSEARNTIMDFLGYCRAMNVEVLASWPNLFAHPSYLKNQIPRENIQRIREFWEDLSVPVIGKAEDSMLGSEFFHDTYYHLNTKGVKKRTDLLIEELKPWYAVPGAEG